MTINIGVPEKTTKLKPRVLVLGVGGGGCNALNLMIASKLNFVSREEFEVQKKIIDKLRKDLKKIKTRKKNNKSS